MSEFEAIQSVDSEPVNPDDDVRAAVIAAMVEHGAPTGNAELPETPDPAAADAETDAQKSDRQRNERGQFTKAEGAETAATVKEVSDADPIAGNTEQPSNAAAPPTSWSADAKAEWSKLSPALQQAVAKRESEISDGQRRWSERERSYDDALTPIREIAQRSGVDERETINRLTAASNWLERDPPGFIQAYANHFGIDLGTLTQTSNQQPQPQADPRFAQLYQTVEQLAQAEQARAQERQTAQINTVQKAMDAVATSPDHPFYNDLQADIAKLIPVLAQDHPGLDPAALLKQAYETAAWANPTTREKLIAARTSQQDAARRTVVKQQADKSRRAAISLNGSPSTIPAAPKADIGESVRDSVVAAWNQHAGA